MSWFFEDAYLSRRRMKHSDILSSQDVNQSTCLNVAYLDKAWLERENVWIRQRKRLRLPFPYNLPIRSGAPAISVDEEGKVRVIE